MSKLTIVAATYGANNQKDVKAQVEALMAKSGGALIIENKTSFNTLFGDHEPGKAKYLAIKYQYPPFGAQLKSWAENHETISLAAIQLSAGGTLQVMVKNAIGLKNTRLLGKANPYVKMVCGGEKFQTKPHKDGGTNPQWNQAFVFNIDGKDPAMHITILDEEIGTDSTIARVDLPLSQLCAASGDVAWPVYDPAALTKQYGTVMLNCLFRDPNSPPASAAAASPAAAVVSPTAAPVVVSPTAQPQVVYMQQPAASGQPQVVYVQQPASPPQVVYMPAPAAAPASPQVVYVQPEAKQAGTGTWRLIHHWDGAFRAEDVSSFNDGISKFLSWNWERATLFASPDGRVMIAWSGETMHHDLRAQHGKLANEAVPYTDTYRVVWHWDGQKNVADFGSFGEALDKFSAVSPDKAAVARVLLHKGKILAIFSGEPTRPVLLS